MPAPSKSAARRAWQVKDVTTIADADKRAYAERVNILCAKDLILNRTSYRTGADFVAALQRAAKAAK